MRHSVTTAAMATAALSSTTLAQDSSSCVSGLYMIVARGTTEPSGPGVTGLLAERIASRIKDSKVVALDYPATFTDPLYTESVTNGTETLGEMVRSYAEDCPDGKMALFGYSQGAHVVGNVICGGGFDEEKAVPKDIVEDHVISITLFGDPTHRANASFNEGTSKNDGLFERPDISTCEDYPFLKSYCDTGDVYCDDGDDRAVHGSYLATYGQDVVENVLKAWNKATDSDVDTDAGSAFGSGSGGSSSTETETTMMVTPTPEPTETPTGTPTDSSTMTETRTETGSETETGEGGSGGSGDGNGEGGGDEDAAVGLSAAGSLALSAPLMLLALWNVL